MSQSKRDSILEALTNTIIGWFVAWATWRQVVVPYFELEVSEITNIHITNIFVAVSIVRGYVVRRIFNRWRLFGHGIR